MIISVGYLIQEDFVHIIRKEMPYPMVVDLAENPFWHLMPGLVNKASDLFWFHRSKDHWTQQISAKCYVYIKIICQFGIAWKSTSSSTAHISNIHTYQYPYVQRLEKKINTYKYTYTHSMLNLQRNGLCLIIYFLFLLSYLCGFN